MPCESQFRIRAEFRKRVNSMKKKGLERPADGGKAALDILIGDLPTRGFVYSPDCGLDPTFLVCMSLRLRVADFGVELRCASGLARPIKQIEVVK